MIEVTRLRHTYPEKAGFSIIRDTGLSEYTFLHFYNSVEILQDGKWIETAPHAVILYDKGTPQHFRSHSPLVHDWMHFTGDASELLQNYGISCDTIYYPGNYNFITKIIAEMETENYGNSKNKTILMHLKFQELFLKLGRAILKEDYTEIAIEMKNRFRYLREEMFSSLGENWSVARMAELVNLSEPRLYAIYKELYGISPVADLIWARINTAKHMLEFETKKIIEIAEALGYQNVTHFIRQFKQYEGISPLGYRKKVNH